MKNIILFTKIAAVENHWRNSLEGQYVPVSINKFDELVAYLQAHGEEKTVMLDESSIDNIEKALDKLNTISNTNLLLFHSIPDANHAIRLIGNNVKGYENSFIHKTNLLMMLQTVESGKNWFFLELTQRIISNYIQDNTQKREPSFVKELTKKEREVTEYVVQGLSNKEIA